MRRQHTRNPRARAGFCAGVVVALLLGPLSGSAPASPATPLDPAFGGTGLVLTDFTGGEDGANAVTTGAGGTVIAAGFGDLGDPDRPHVAGFGVARYLSDGSPDPSFSGDGRTLVDFGFVNQAAAAVAVDAFGRIVVTGTITTFDGSTSSIGVARLLGDGSPDPAFGSGGLTILHPGILSNAYDLAIDGEGRTIVIGAATGNKGFRPMLLRFTQGGLPDPDFGGDGIRSFGKVGRDAYTSIAIDRRGRLLLAGSSRPNGRGRTVAAVRRTSAAGRIDRGFGDHGVALPLGRMGGAAADLAVDGSGRPTIAATCACGPHRDDDFAVGRVTPRGRADRSFSGDGRRFIRFGPSEARPSSIVVDGDGRVVVAGSVRVQGVNDWALARLKPNGRPDRAFGDDGTITAALGAGVEGVQGVAVDAASRVLAVGLGAGTSSSDFAVARFR